MVTTILIVLASAVLLTWLARHVAITRAPGWETFLRADADAAPPDPAPLISVLIPARNEARNIARTLEHLLSQNYPRLEVIVADDRSEDDTADIVRRFVLKDPRVRLVQYRDLPEGWTGKNHVVWQISQQARGEILLLLDADVTLDPGALPVLVAHFLENRLDAFSMLLRLDSTCFWERATRVLLGAVLMLRFPLKQVNDPKSPRAFANGQLIMVRADVYRAVDGHRGVRSLLADDVALARRIKQHGYRITVACGFDIGSARMYSSLADLWRGWSRILYGALRGRLSVLFFAMAMLLAFTLFPYVTLVVSGACLLAGGGGGMLVLFLLSIAELAALLSLSYRLHRMSRSEPVYVAMNFVAGLVALGILITAVSRRFSSKGVVWKGTRYDARSGMW